MTSDVLQTRSQIRRARAELRRRGLSFADGALRGALRRARLLGGLGVGDVTKSWDVLRTADFIERHVEPDAPILDIGAYASEILGVLHRLGYRKLAGIDLNPAVGAMPHADRIRYVVADFLRAPFADGSFHVVTAISVIEHGFRRVPLLSEVARLLRPGGYFLASFDYWPEKLDTSGVELFGTDWCIFSREDVLSLVDGAAAVGLRPLGPLALEAQSPPIAWGGRRYSFAWLALRKDAGPPDARPR